MPSNVHCWLRAELRGAAREISLELLGVAHADYCKPLAFIETEEEHAAMSVGERRDVLMKVLRRATAGGLDLKIVEFTGVLLEVGDDRTQLSLESP